MIKGHSLWKGGIFGIVWGISEVQFVYDHIGTGDGKVGRCGSSGMAYNEWELLGTHFLGNMDLWQLYHSL